MFLDKNSSLDQAMIIAICLTRGLIVRFPLSQLILQVQLQFHYNFASAKCNSTANFSNDRIWI